MYGLLFWVYIWLTMALRRVEAGAWIFLVIVTLVYLSIDFLMLLGASTWEDVSISILFNGLILLYCMLPGVRTAFGTASYRWLGANQQGYALAPSDVDNFH